tara:strand:+ start:141 stop:479 length:339 start_codon:yes stop_codon:yes gene_type:complete
MNIQGMIERHKKGEISFLKIKRPQFICESDEDYIDYINYCWGFINTASFDLATMSFFNDEDHAVLVDLAKEVGRAHGILGLCHKYLSGKAEAIKKVRAEVYTTKIGHNRRGT